MRRELKKKKLILELILHPSVTIYWTGLKTRAQLNQLSLTSGVPTVIACDTAQASRVIFSIYYCIFIYYVSD